MTCATSPFRSILLAVLLAVSLGGGAREASALQTPRSGEEIYASTCAACHEPGGIVPATRMEVIRTMSAEAIFTVLDRGMMAQQAGGLTTAERRTVAEYLSGFGSGATPPSLPVTTEGCVGAAGRVGGLETGPAWRSWGAGMRGTRFQPAAEAGLTAADVPQLQLQWAFAIPGVTQMRSQPVVAGGRVFVAAVNGAVNALEASTGCLLWTTTVSPAVRGGLVLAEIAAGRHALIIPSQSGDLHALDAATGASIWRVSVSDHPRTALTGTPLFHEGRLYVPISAGESSRSMPPRGTFFGGTTRSRRSLPCGVSPPPERPAGVRREHPYGPRRPSIRSGAASTSAWARTSRTPRPRQATPSMRSTSRRAF